MYIEQNIEFECLAPVARNVYLVGDFNDWSTTATPMERTLGGLWFYTLTLSPGRYEFKYLIDGSWYCEPGCDEKSNDCTTCVRNPFGTMNRVIEIHTRDL